MPSPQLFLYAFLGIVVSVWGLVMLFEGRGDTNFKMLVMLAVTFTCIIFKALWESWRDIRDCRAKAISGDRDAMFELSELVLPSSKAEALEWAEKAAALGHRGASFLSGYLRYGMGLRDQVTFSYFLSAAERGDEPAMRAVADCYKLGQCVLPNDRLSFEWRFKSATSWESRYDPMLNLRIYDDAKATAPGFVQSQYRVGMCYLRGEGCEKNVVEAFAWLLLAARAGHKGANLMVRELDRRKMYKLRALMQDRSVQISQALENGGVVEPIQDSSTGLPPSVLTEGQADESFPASAAVSDPDPVSAWRAFFTVFMSGNLMMGFLLVGAKSSDVSRVRPEVNGALYFGFLVAAVVAALWGRKFHPLVDLLSMVVGSVAASAAFAFWGAASLVSVTIGASLAAGLIVFPASALLIHWRHPISTFLFYALFVIHSLGMIPVFLN